MTTSKKVLIVTGVCPSHPYACVKLATVLAKRHDVTVAGPNGSALSRLQAETRRYNESTTAEKRIGCLSIGDDTTLVYCNVRPVVDPSDYSPLEIIYNALFNPKYNPFGLADGFEQMMDEQESTYEVLLKLLPNYDLVYAVHSAAATVCDAAESLKRDGGASAVPPVIVFSSLPYDSSFIYKGMWSTPRSIVGLPHVATYSSLNQAIKRSGLIAGLASYCIQLFWMWLDTTLAERAWVAASKRTDERRARRGLPPVDGAGNRYYWRSYPLLSLGGIKPYITDGDRIADNATVVGSIQSAETSDLSSLDDWLSRIKSGTEIIYASFGTGTILSDEEAANVARLGLSLQSGKDTNYCLLLSLQEGDQARLRHVFDGVLGSTPTRAGGGYIEYMHGLVRIDCDVPQENLLLSKRVVMFVSHMGFGAFTEAIYAGVPFVAYPAGCDQWYNAERAVEAGVAVKAQPKMSNLDGTVFAAIGNESLRERARQLALDAANFDSNQIILDMADEIMYASGCDNEKSEADSVCSTEISASSRN